MDTSGEIRYAASRFIYRAGRFIAGKIGMQETGNTTFAIFNPLNWDVTEVKFNAVINMPSDTESFSGQILTAKEKFA